MKTVYDIQQFLKSFGTIIYTGDRLADLELMETELQDLQHSQLMEQRDFEMALLILRQEIQTLKDKQNPTKR
ncbi:YqgQ family protein [Bacillus sp. BRMEA1]|uniref:YqgQ family protein n=1 Tax=Neobacillus endophyticus TaxID=2738405 RepID=UPI00156719BC|nr:YqgQ family protein [Neobacillus endophyticus]NRD80751.1 YqgQ family protein [Neobacillus endophyticus]